MTSTYSLQADFANYKSKRLKFNDIRNYPKGVSYNTPDSLIYPQNNLRDIKFLCAKLTALIKSFTKFLFPS